MNLPQAATGTDTLPPVNVKHRVDRLHKKLAIRLGRVHLLLNMVGELGGYEATQPTESFDGLRVSLEKLMANSQSITQCCSEFEQATRWRQYHYALGPNSLKEVATLLWVGFSAAYPARTLSH